MSKHKDPSEQPQPRPQQGGAREQERRGETPVSPAEPEVPEPRDRGEAGRRADEATEERAGEGAPSSSGGRAWRPGDPTPMPPPGRIEQPQAQPLDATREGAGAWSSPPPGQEPPGERAAGVPRHDDPGRLPRVVPQSYRAAEGEARYKIRADIPGEASRTLYVLARRGDREGAAREYARVARLAGVSSRMGADGKISEAGREFDFVIKELAD